MPGISFLPKSRFEREPLHGTLIALLISATFALTACGGGGGGGGSVGATETTESTSDSTSSTAPTIDAQAQSFKTAATALPKFGSVTQSSNVDSNGRTTDQASVDFDGTTVEVAVTQASGSSFTFASSDDAWRSGTIDPATQRGQFVPPGQTDVRYSYHVHESTESLFFASYIERGWGDSDNWYVRGYWLRGGQNPYLHKADVELGTFIDSPEIDSASPPDLAGDRNGHLLGRRKWRVLPRFCTRWQGDRPIHWRYDPEYRFCNPSAGLLYGLYPADTALRPLSLG